jgi:hypothetical protein
MVDLTHVTATSCARFGLPAGQMPPMEKRVITVLYDYELPGTRPYFPPGALLESAAAAACADRAQRLVAVM